MKKLLALTIALLSISNLYAQTYKVGDFYDVEGKKGVVFEVSEDGKHGTIIALTQPEGIMPWAEAMVLNLSFHILAWSTIPGSWQALSKRRNKVR